MAKKFESFKLDDKKKAIIIYTNVDTKVADEEKEMREFYLNKGYLPMKEEKKAPVTIADMRRDFGEDKEALAEFDRLYKLKPDEIEEVGKNGKKKTGFHLAAKYHADYKKAHKTEKKKK